VRWLSDRELQEGNAGIDREQHGDRKHEEYHRNHGCQVLSFPI
jgi:hypothetical protein